MDIVVARPLEISYCACIAISKSAIRGIFLAEAEVCRFVIRKVADIIGCTWTRR